MGKNYSIDRRKNGTYRIRAVVYVDGKQVRKSCTYAPRPELSDKQNMKVAEGKGEELVKTLKEEIADRKEMTFGEYFNMYYPNSAKRHLAKTTLRTNSGIIRKHFLDEYGRKGLSEITQEMMQKTIYALCNGPDDDEDPEDRIDLKSQTVKRYMEAPRGLLEMAVEDGFLAEHPIKTELHYLKFSPVNVVCLDEADYRKIVEDLEKKMTAPVSRLSRNDLIVALGLLSGVRRGELVALRWENIIGLSRDNLDNVKIDIRHSACKVAGELQKIGDTKTVGSVRMFTIPLLLAKVLLNWKESILARNGYVAESDFIISNGDGRMVSVYSPTRWFKDYLKEHNFKDVKLHSLRHTFASMLLETGMDIYTLKDVMGHTRISTTEIYLKSFKMRNKSLMANLNRYTADLVHMPDLNSSLSR